MNSDPSMLACGLVLDEDGHLTDGAVTALSDGELALLPADAVHHAEICASCALRVGQAALFSLELSEVLAPAGPLLPLPVAQPLAATGVVRYVGARPRAPLPAVPLAVSLALTVLGCLPLLAGAAAWLTELPALLARGLPRFLRLVALVLDPTASMRGLDQLSWLAAAMLVLAGTLVARRSRRSGRASVAMEGLS